MRAAAEKSVLPFLVVASLLLAGCGHVSGGVAASNIPLEQGKHTVIQSDVHGSDCLVNLLGFIPVSGGNETRRALKFALEDAPGADALINISVDSYSQHWILFSKNCTEMYATAVRIQD